MCHVCDLHLKLCPSPLNSEMLEAPLCVVQLTVYRMCRQCIAAPCRCLFVVHSLNKIIALLLLSFFLLVVFCFVTARCTLVQSAVLRSHVVCLSVYLSVCPSVTLVDQDHIGQKSWKLIARTLCLTPSLFVVQRPSTYSQGNMGKFWGD